LRLNRSQTPPTSARPNSACHQFDDWNHMLIRSAVVAGRRGRGGGSFETV
jgi:hypothetical protein